MNSFNRLLTGMVMAGMAGISHAAIYKCENAKGQAVFQDRACHPLKQVFVIHTPGDKIQRSAASGEQLAGLLVPPVSVSPELRYVISDALVDQNDWLSALQSVRSQAAVKESARYSVLRIWLEGAAAGDKIQLSLQGRIGQPGDSLGGQYMQTASGDFVVLEHTHPQSWQNDKQRLLIGSAAFGNTEIWLAVPPTGQVSAVGDLVLRQATIRDTGDVVIRFGDTVAEMQPDAVILGAQTSAGDFGQVMPCVTENECRIERMSAGFYWVAFPGRKGKWPIEIQAGQTQTLDFVLLDDGQLRLKEELGL